MHRLIHTPMAIAIVASGIAFAAATARADDCADGGTSELGVGLIEHSCFHTTNGPFVSLVATPGALATATTANLDAVHTHYAVAIDVAQPSVVTYMPVRTGTWAIFGDLETPHALFDPEGQEVPVVLHHSVPACPAIPLVRVYALTALTRYTLRLGPSTAARTTTPVVVEKVSDFAIPHGRDDDSDGFGGAQSVVTTACVPPPGYVRNVADCDDADPEVHPDAAETCNGADENCNGIADEHVCTVGGGGCLAAPPASGSPGALAMIALLAAVLAGLAPRKKTRR